MARTFAVFPDDTDTPGGVTTDDDIETKNPPPLHAKVSKHSNKYIYEVAYLNLQSYTAEQKTTITGCV